MNTDKLTVYADLIRLLLTGRIDVLRFESEYLALFKNDATNWTEEEFAVLDELFADVDAFCRDPDLRGPGDLDEEQLREKSRIALDRLTILQRE